jgi:acyl carrier protein
MTNTRIAEAVFQVVDELNEQLPREQRLEKAEATLISGVGAQLDSLGLVNLIVGVEQKVQDEFNVTVTLTDEAMLSGEQPYLRSIGSLIGFLSSVVEGNGNG